MFTVEYSTCGGVTISNKNSYVTLEFLLQPIYLPKSGETIYCECLSRVINESGETLNSESFFDNIDDEFIKTVFLLQMEYFSSIKTSKGIFLNLNLSALEDDEFVEKVINKNIYNKFHIEINEISTSIKYSKILKNIKRLQKLGMFIVLDDYYEENIAAHLSLGLIEWDYIKIDRSFLLYNSGDDDCLKSLIFVLRPYCKHGLIIEGVETYFQNEYLKKYNILAQGYFYSRPRKVTNEREDHQESELMKKKSKANTYH
ncbi:diguanylate phosphodiesterase [Vibrio natriegens]|uniref:EAL domain-containing protein n=1 Tax=Vibrio natriegens TaxID=691 RepID=UPI00080430F6|nr:EAL domain-containing protein [Vibrio natriegens]ANQ20523.1 diguanylate phosphodiesterase [Vibrio natriegens]